MVPYHYPMADFTISQGETNVIHRERLIVPLLNTTGLTQYRNDQNILDTMTDNSSPSIAINIGQLVFCNGDRCHHGRKASLSKEIGQALARSFSFVKNLRKGSSRRHRKTTTESSESSLGVQDHQQAAKNSNLTMDIHELDTQFDHVYEMPACGTNGCVTEMEASLSTFDIPMPSEYHQVQETRSTQSMVAVFDHPSSPNPFTSALYPKPRSSVMSPVSTSWMGSGSDQPSWHTSQYSSVSEITPHTSMSESDQFQQRIDASFDTSLNGLGPALTLCIPPAPQAVFSDKDLSMSPIAGDFDVSVMHEQMQNDAETTERAVNITSTHKPVENTWQAQDLLVLETVPVYDIDLELEVSMELLEETHAVSMYPNKLDGPEQNLSMPLHPANFSIMLKDAVGRFIKKMSACCPSEIVTCLTEIFSQTALSLQEHVNVSEPGKPFTLKQICSPAPSISGALLGLHALLAASGSQDDLDTMCPKSQQLISLAILGYSLLCLVLSDGGDLSRAISSLHAQACSWSAVIHDKSEAATYRELVDKYWLLNSEHSLNAEFVLPDYLRPERLTCEILRSSEEGSSTLIVDIAYMFIHLVASTVPERQCETASKCDHMMFDLPPSFEDVMKERLESSNSTSSGPLSLTSFAVIEQYFKIGGVKSFEELESCLEPQFRAKGWTSNDLFPMHLKSILKKAEGFYKGRLVMWLWRVLDQGIKSTSQRTVAGQHEADLLKYYASPPANLSMSEPQEKRHSPLSDKPSEQEKLLKLCNAGQWPIKPAPSHKKSKKLHNKTHPSQYPDFRCDICSKVFTGQWAKGNLGRHKKYTKKHGKQYETCELCKRQIGLVRSDHFRNHMKKVHSR